MSGFRDLGSRALGVWGLGLGDLTTYAFLR